MRGQIYGVDLLGCSMIGDAFRGTVPATAGRSSNPILPIVALLAMLALLGFFALSHGSDESSLGHDLQAHGVRTVGTVTVADQSNHDHFEYSFIVNGLQHSGDSGSFTSAVAEDASQYQVGQHIPVTYDAEDPKQSCSCDVDLLASSAWFNDLFPLLIAISAIGAAVIALLVQHRKMRSAGG
jgi:hypothetical protein